MLNKIYIYIKYNKKQLNDINYLTKFIKRKD